MSSEIPPTSGVSSTGSSPAIRSRTIPLHIFQGTPVEAMPELFLPTPAVKSSHAAIATASLGVSVIDPPAMSDEDFESATIERIHLREHFTALHAPSPAIPIGAKMVASSPINFPPSPSPRPIAPSTSFDFESFVRADSLSKSTSFSAASSSLHPLQHSVDDDEWESTESMIHTPASFSRTPSSTTFDADDLDATIASARRASTTAKAHSNMRRMIDARAETNGGNSQLFTPNTSEFTSEILEADEDEFVVVEDE
jgi:hypothetical protein